MSKAILYCDNCARLIPPSASDSGSAVIDGDGALCPSCAAKLPATSPAARASQSPDAGPSGSRRSRALKQAKGARSRTGPTRPLVVSLGLVIVATTAVATVVMSSTRRPSNERAPTKARPMPSVVAAPAPPPTPTPVHPVGAIDETDREATPPATEASPRGESHEWSEQVEAPAEPSSPTAAERLSAVRERISPGLHDYGEVRAALQSLADEFRDRPEGREAQRLLGGVDEQYAEAARAELEGAVQAAEKLSASGKFDAALSMLRSVAPRFGEGDWYANEGEAAIRRAIADVEDKRAESSQRTPPPGAAGPGVASIVLFNDAVRPDWETTSWGGAVFSVRAGDSHAGSAAALFLESRGASPWSGCHLTTRGTSAAGQNAYALSEAVRRDGSLVFFVNGSTDSGGRHRGGQKLQTGIARRTSGGGTWQSGGSVPIDEFIEGGAIDSDAGTWQKARIPLSRLMAKGAVTVLGDVGFQFIGDAPAAGVVVDSIVIESGATPDRVPDGKDPELTRVAKDAPRPEVIRPPVALSADIVVNGGFELFDDTVRFAAGWRAHVWGRGDPRSSIRIDRTNSHDGERSLAVRTSVEGAEPGAYRSLGTSLQPGTYEVSFWACADAGEEARATIQLGALEPFTTTVGEDWQEFSTRVVVKGRLYQPAVRVRSGTRNVRVWFDDVSVKRVASR